MSQPKHKMLDITLNAKSDKEFKTRDNLLAIVDYIIKNKVARNSEIAQICNVGSDRARVLLLTLVENNILRPEGDKKDRRYTLS